jgi:benzoyl-CoA reductase/2-hydroxyglutaryl-CoA dehydratase subunit BcrC/BadD/HgdB
VDYCLRQALEAGAEGAIFFILSGDHPASWDYPEQRRALEAHGIPTLLLPWQPYAGADAAEIRARIEPFVSAIVQPISVTGARP